MVLTKKKMKEMMRNGVEFLGTDGKPAAPKGSAKQENGKIMLGVTLLDGEGKPMSLDDSDEDEKKDLELDYLAKIASLLTKILEKPVPKFPDIKPPNVIVNPTPVTVNPPAITVKPPDITVKPTDVTVNPPKVTVNAPDIPKPIRKWKFALKKDVQGYTEEITATAIE